jgi:hypothetical protein
VAGAWQIVRASFATRDFVALMRKSRVDEQLG